MRKRKHRKDRPAYRITLEDGTYLGRLEVRESHFYAFPPGYREHIGVGQINADAAVFLLLRHARLV
jgi:hypothetical protein